MRNSQMRSINRRKKAWIRAARLIDKRHNKGNSI
jgi:hypothetical protein